MQFHIGIDLSTNLNKMNKEAKKCPVLFIRFKKYMLIRHLEPVQILLCLNLRIVSEQNLNKLLVRLLAII